MVRGQAQARNCALNEDFPFLVAPATRLLHTTITTTPTPAPWFLSSAAIVPLSCRLCVHGRAKRGQCAAQSQAACTAASVCTRPDSRQGREIHRMKWEENSWAARHAVCRLTGLLTILHFRDHVGRHRNLVCALVLPRRYLVCCLN